MLTQLGFFPGASAAWFQLTVTFTHAFGPGKQKCPRLLAGAGQNAPAANKREHFCVECQQSAVSLLRQRQRRNWFPERAGSAPAKGDFASNREAKVRSAALAPLVHFAEQNF